MSTFLKKLSVAERTELEWLEQEFAAIQAVASGVYKRSTNANKRLALLMGGGSKSPAAASTRKAAASKAKGGGSKAKGGGPVCTALVVRGESEATAGGTPKKRRVEEVSVGDEEEAEEEEEEEEEEEAVEEAVEDAEDDAAKQKAEQLLLAQKESKKQQQQRQKIIDAHIHKAGAYFFVDAVYRRDQTEQGTIVFVKLLRPTGTLQKPMWEVEILSDALAKKYGYEMAEGRCDAKGKLTAALTADGVAAMVANGIQTNYSINDLLLYTRAAGRMSSRREELVIAAKRK